MSDIDPLVAEVFNLGKECANDEYWGDDERKAAATSALARLSAVLAASRDAVAAVRAVEALVVPYAPCPGHTNEAGARDDGRHDACPACQANDRADAELEYAERVLAGAETNLCAAIDAADGAL